jgi:hypothetical protein
VARRALKSTCTCKLIAGIQLFRSGECRVLRIDVFKELLSRGIGSVGDAVFSDEEPNQCVTLGRSMAETRHANEQPGKSPFSAASDGFREHFIPQAVSDGSEFRGNQRLGLPAQIFPSLLQTSCDF